MKQKKFTLRHTVSVFMLCALFVSATSVQPAHAETSKKCEPEVVQTNIKPDSKKPIPQTGHASMLFSPSTNEVMTLDGFNGLLLRTNVITGATTQSTYPKVRVLGSTYDSSTQSIWSIITPGDTSDKSVVPAIQRVDPKTGATANLVNFQSYVGSTKLAPWNEYPLLLTVDEKNKTLWVLVYRRTYYRATSNYAASINYTVYLDKYTTAGSLVNRTQILALTSGNENESQKARSKVTDMVYEPTSGSVWLLRPSENVLTKVNVKTGVQTQVTLPGKVSRYMEHAVFDSNTGTLRIPHDGNGSKGALYNVNVLTNKITDYPASNYPDIAVGYKKVIVSDPVVHSVLFNRKGDVMNVDTGSITSYSGEQVQLATLDTTNHRIWYWGRTADGTNNVVLKKLCLGTQTTDTTAPTTPTNLKATVASSTQINLSWTVSTDVGGIKGYNIYKDTSTTPLNATPVTGTTFSGTGLTPSTSYTFNVEAIDTAGNKSSKVSVVAKTLDKPATPTTTADKTAPGIPGVASLANLHGVAGQGWALTLNWGKSTDNVGVTGYIVKRRSPNPSTLGTMTSNAIDLTAKTGFTVGSASVPVNNVFEIQAKDAAGNVSGARVVTIQVTWPNSFSYPGYKIVSDTTDTTAPTAPTKLGTKSVSEGAVVLAWDPSTDAGGMAGYNVYRNGTKITATPITATTYPDKNVSAGVEYKYTVEAVDKAGNKTMSGESVTANIPLKVCGSTQASGVGCVPPPTSSSTADKIAPTTPGAVSFTTPRAVTGKGFVTTLSWGKSTDNVGVASYVVKRLSPSAATVGTVTGSSIDIATGNGGYTGSSYSTPVINVFEIQAKDAAGNVSGSRIVKFRATVGLGSITITVDSNTTDASTQKGTTPAVNAPTPTPDTTIPTTPTNLKAVVASSTQINLSWTASTDAGGIKGYNIYKDTSTTPLNATPVTTTTYANTGLAPSTSYTFNLEAIDNAGNKSTKVSVIAKTSDKAVVTTQNTTTQTSTTTQPTTSTADKTAPAVPGATTVTSLRSVSGQGWTVTLGWGKSTDNVGVTGYVVKRRSPNPATITTTTGVTADLSGLASPNDYVYEVQAKDAAGNLSASRVVKFKFALPGVCLCAPTIQNVSDSVDTTTQKTVAMVPSPATLTSAERKDGLAALLEKLVALKAMLASVGASQ